jgi:hypothetical protein
MRELQRTYGQEKDAAVSSFSVREARAIRLWLEAVRGSGVFRLDSSAGEYLGYALAYWREREQGASVDQQRNPLRNECNDIGPPDMSDITDAGNSILVGASWEGFDGCQPEIAPSATLTTDIPSSGSDGNTTVIYANWEGPGASWTEKGGAENGTGPIK